MRIDFTEIPDATGGTPGADTWEFFARDFLVALGLEHESGPDRGPDDGRDLTVLEHRASALAGRKLRWVVSAKHRAHSGKSVSDADEVDVAGRVAKFNAQGFVAFYSTLPSATLGRTFERLRDRYDVHVFDQARIELHLLTPPLREVFKRYFPKSYAKWEQAMPFPIVDQYEPLPCVVCGQDLLVTERRELGNIVFVHVGRSPERVVDVYCSCKACDRIAAEPHRMLNDVRDPWTDINDAIIPRRYLEIINTVYNELRSGTVVYDDDAFRKYQGIMLRLAQLVVRETTSTQRRRLTDLDELPA